MSKSWEELGNRIAAARKQRGLTQHELAAALDMERTSITKIEAGTRKVDSLELARLARVLRRPIGWFLTDPPPSVVSRREGRDSVVRDEDIQLEQLAADVEQLVALNVLTPRSLPPIEVDSIQATEAAALQARQLANLNPTEPAWDLVHVAETLGLYAFVLPLENVTDTAGVEGSYLALERGGVALLGGSGDSGRRRFTLAHELGHHVLADQYATEWVVGSGATERERVINAFAIHFLMPRAAVEQRWGELQGASKPRDAAIRIAVEFGLSWSAACAQLSRVGCLTDEGHEQLLQAPPTAIDYVERELRIRSDLEAPLVPPAYAAAVIRALRKGKIGPERALEMLHGTLPRSALPTERSLSLEAMSAELAPLPR